MNNYQCKNQTHLQCQQFSMQQCLLYFWLWEMKNHVELQYFIRDGSNVSHCLNSAETLFLSFIASKAQVIGRNCSVVPWAKMTEFKSGTSEEFCACYEKRKRTHYYRAPSLHCFILLRMLFMPKFKTLQAFIGDSLHFLYWLILHLTAGLNVPGAVAVSLSVGHSTLTGSRAAGPPRPGWPLTVHWLRTFIAMLYTLTTTAPLQTTHRNTHISLNDNGL